MSPFERLGRLLALLAAGVLLVAGLLIAVYSEHSYRQQKIKEVGVQAQILASTVPAALVFKDLEAAKEYVAALKANPEVRSAALYDEAGELFVSYSRDKSRPPPAMALAQGVTFKNNALAVVTPVVQGETVLGTVYLEAGTEPFAQRLARYAPVALLVVMASLLLGVLGVAQGALRQAHKELARRAEDLAETNAQLRAQIEEREKAEEALRQVQKMETIGQLTGGIAHDFNNLLTIILGNLERLQRHLDVGGGLDLLRTTADNAIQGAKRAAVLTRSLLAFSRRQPLNPRPIDINRLLTNMSDLLRRTLGEQITIENVGAGGLWRTFVDLNQLENAVLNLAVNARDAMPDGGKLTIETANTYLDARYAAGQSDLAPGQYVSLSITDTGTGMTKDVIEKAFDPFFTTKDIGHGTGLGLSQVYGFVKQSGGHVRIYSELGQGTTIRIYLPRLLAEEETVAAADPADVLLRGDPSEAVLIVEDDEGVREHSVTLLKDLGYRVLEASTGARALELLETHSDIALLFTDVGLPGGMNGRQLADEARRRRPDLKVLFTTGYARNAIVHDGRLDPGVQLITKPFTQAELANAVRDVLDARLRSPCILVVEDEVLIRMTIVQTLEDLGFLVLEAGTATEAMSKMRLANGAISAALVDLGLPDQKGDLLAAELRAMHKHMPLVIATGYAEGAVRERFSSDPLVGFLSKPFESRELAAVLRALKISVPASGS